MLWSKPLKSGTALELVIPSSRRKGYLLNAYPKGPELCFGSDAITHSYTTWTSWDLAAVTHHTDAMAKLAYEQIWKI